MAVRSEFDKAAQDLEGNAYANVQVHVYLAGTTTYASIYAAKSGGGTLSNPITTGPTGNVQFWADPGSYDIKFHDLTVPARFSDRTITWEAVSGQTDGVHWTQIDLPTGGIPTADIADAAVTNPKLAPNAVAAGNIQAGIIDITKIAASLLPNFVPTGTILMTARSAPPSGFLSCDGAAVSRTTFSDLWNAIGTNFGVGNGSSTFNVPNLNNGRVPMGVGNGHTLAETGGADTVTLTSAQIPGHTHSYTTPGHTHSVSTSNHSHSTTIGAHSHSTSGSVPGSVAGAGGSAVTVLGGAGSVGVGVTVNSGGGGTYGSSSAGGETVTSGSGGSSSGTTGTTGSGGSHSNLQPYQVVYYMIKI